MENQNANFCASTEDLEKAIDQMKDGGVVFTSFPDAITDGFGNTYCNCSCNSDEMTDLESYNLRMECFRQAYNIPTNTGSVEAILGNAEKIFNWITMME